MSEMFIKMSLSAVYFNLVIMDYKRKCFTFKKYEMNKKKHFQTGL